MRRLAVLASVAVLPAVALAQSLGQALAPITTTPLQPPQSPAVATPAPTDQTPPAQEAPRAAPPPAQATWLPQTTAQLQVLDKVNAQNAVLNVKVGQETQFGSLNIQVQACDTRAPDQPPDSAAYLTITDSHTDAPGFRGWMLANNPSLSMLEHPVYDVRVIGCKA